MAVEARTVLPVVDTRARRIARVDIGGVVVALTAGGSIVGLGLANGGYFPVSWGWGAVAFLIVVGVVLVTGLALRPGRLEVAIFGLLAALTGWTALSMTWSLDVSSTVDEVERTLVYLTAAAAVLLLVRLSRTEGLLFAVWLALTGLACYGLAIWLFPQYLGFEEATWRYRLSAPVGYWNAFGVLCTMGTLLAVGIAASRRGIVRAAAGASTVVLTTTLYFTFSRGALVALAVGAVVAIVCDQRRVQFAGIGAVLVPWSLLSALAAHHSFALTNAQAPLTQVARDGHGMAAIVIGLAAAAAFTMFLFDIAEARVTPPTWTTRAFYALAAVVVIAAAGAVAARYGSPATIARKAYHSFATSSSPGDGGGRLFSASSNGRSEEWHTALQAFRAHPWSGTGAGTYDVYWFQHRRQAINVHDAHNLYLETLAELGPVGLVLLVAMLLVPVAGFVRARAHPLAAAALAAYVAFVVHAAVDWDWEMPVVTLTALVLGFALIGARRTERSARAGIPLRVGGGLAVAAAGTFVVWTLLGNLALSSSVAATESGQYAEGVRDGKNAATFLPWSSQPWRRVGEAQAAAGRLAAARVSIRKAIEKEPDDWTLWFDLAQVSSGKERQAALAEALRLDPMSPEIANWHP